MLQTCSPEMACWIIEIGWRSEGPFVLVTKWQLQPMALLYETLHGHFMNFDFIEEHKLTPPTSWKITCAGFLKGKVMQVRRRESENAAYSLLIFVVLMLQI